MTATMRDTKKWWCGLPELAGSLFGGNSLGAAVRVARNLNFSASVIPTWKEKTEVPAIELTSDISNTSRVIERASGSFQRLYLYAGSQFFFHNCARKVRFPTRSPDQGLTPLR